MKITFDETLSRKEWLHRELLNSLTGDIIEKATEDRFYDVKLLVNGVELEPTIYNDLVGGIEKYVEQEARSLINEKVDGIMTELNNGVVELTEQIQELSERIKDKLNQQL